MGSRNNQNKGRGKREKRGKSTSAKASSTKKILPPQSQPSIKETSSQEKKKPWYNSQLMKGIFIGLFSSGCIGFTIYFIQSCESEKIKTQLIENQNFNNDTLQISLGVVEEALKEVKTNQEETKKLFKQHPNSEEYEKSKKELNEKFEMFKDSISKSIDSSLMKAKIELQNMIVRDIAYINAFDWSKIFDGGYSIFRIGIDKKLHLIYRTLNQSITINWNNAKLDELNNDKISLRFLSVIEPNQTFGFTNSVFAFPRIAAKLNKIFLNRMFFTKEKEFYMGLIADNSEGIIGIIGCVNSTKWLDGKQILDYHKLQQITQIEMGENKIK